jgi:membrane fusion protein (multidrug efflux system)
MFKRNFIFILLLLSVIAGLAFYKYQQMQQGMTEMAASAPPPTSVEVTEAKSMKWQPRISAVGTLTSLDGIDVRNEVEGIVEKIHITSGQRVKKGDLLVMLNDDVEQADLVSFKAQEDLARSLFKRNENMWKKKTISETDYDNARSNLKVAQANVVQTRARIAKKSIRAPFAGVLGIRHISTGEYLPPGTMMVSLQDYSQLYIDFAVVEKYFPDVTVGLEVEFRVSAYADRSFIGQVQAVDAKVNEATRNISVRAQLANEDNLLRPGMYADIDLMLDRPADVIVVPATSIVYSSFGNALFVVEDDGKGGMVARRVTITTGEQRGDQVVISEGLSGSERVVQAGVSKLRNNVPVTITEQVRLKANAEGAIDEGIK